MRLALIYAFVLISIIACGSDIERKIPPSMTNGAVENLNLSIEKQTGKSRYGGTLIKAYGVVPFNIKREQIRPTLLAAIRVLKQNNPGCEWFWVGIVPETMALAKTGRLVGRAEYTEGELDIYYGIPSDKQMDEWNAQIGKPVKDLLGGDTYINDSPRLYSPDKEIFNSGIKALRSYDRLSIANSGAGLYGAVSKETGIGVKKIKPLISLMNNYYTPGNWGKETISLK